MSTITIISLPPGDHPPMRIGSYTHLYFEPGARIVVPDGAAVTALVLEPFATCFRIDDPDIRGNLHRGGVGNHGIRLQGATKGIINRAKIFDSASYGIGFQGVDMFRYIEINFADIIGCGRDGIDIKNDSGLVRDINLNGVLVRDHGLKASGCAAIDHRGRINTREPRIENLKAGQYGLRYRMDGPTGNGSANWSSVSGGLVRCKGADRAAAVFVEPGSSNYPKPNVAGLNTVEVIS